MVDKMLISGLVNTLLVYHKNLFKTFILPFFKNIDGGEKETKNLERPRCHDLVLSADEIGVVVHRLGMPQSKKDEEGESNGVAVEGVMDVINELLEEKNASVEELRQAFRVFDMNEDGAISPGELWCLLRRLGLQEGLKLSTCEAMIRAFDEDGDGTINFKEFTCMMENSS
ncbi:calmodulin-like protein 2 [Zingiber officinale]|uniref:EF-hand domain-containing protein n=1 Tax=Zingiber officinale TaxID=94328 RepID=A0A8J5LFL4_ZINOF|nr:calmodulin-like protein 2 [Zingiber officinale]XP_042381247.1 calmodulin-like protein 2 [Zingiber officinale]KAG6513122.1 hypothetical protein ZIOFF_023430 [Zingiber officinale]